MYYLTLLPIEMQEIIVSKLTTRYRFIDEIRNLILTSKYFNAACKERLRILTCFVGGHLRIHKIRYEPIPLVVSNSDILTREQCKDGWSSILRYYHDSFIKNIKYIERCNLKEMAYHKERYIMSFSTTLFNSLNAASLMHNYKFIANNILKITHYCLSLCDDLDETLWGKEYHAEDVAKGRMYFEGTLFTIIRIAMKLVKKSVYSHKNMDSVNDPYFKKALKSSIKSLNYILNENYHGMRGGHGIYNWTSTYGNVWYPSEYTDNMWDVEDDKLYNKVLNCYSKMKTSLDQSVKKELSRVVFDNIDYETIKNHYESKTLERCTSAFLRKFLAGRSPNYSWSKTSGCKNALVNDAYSAFGTGT